MRLEGHIRTKDVYRAFSCCVSGSGSNDVNVTKLGGDTGGDTLLRHSGILNLWIDLCARAGKTQMGECDNLIKVGWAGNVNEGRVLAATSPARRVKPTRILEIMKHETLQDPIN